jgi:hypothetical protein
MLKVVIPERCVQAVLAAAWALTVPVSGGEAYFTSFENFAVGDDKIIGTDGWLGSHAGLKLHGIMGESSHGVVGIGNAAYLGGYPALMASNSKLVNVRRPVNLDPVALNQEVATLSVVFGIKDSSSASSYRRDNFEFLIYNLAGALLGGVQMDNTTLTGTGGVPQRLIYRVAWNGTIFQYYNTGYTFLPQTLELLQFRINYRTNRWTATLGGVPLFEDLVFYSGSSAKNLGSVVVQMRVTNPTTSSTSIYPGDNYMLFDDYSIRTDPVTTTLSVSRTAGGAALLTWNEEAGYRYQVEYSTDTGQWLTDLVGSGHTAAVTGTATFTDPTLPVPVRRLYRVKRSYP